MALAALALASAPVWSAPIEADRLAARAVDHLNHARPAGVSPMCGAATDADAVFGMAYAQAEDDFNRVEINYLTSLGRLAEAEGEAAMWKDLRQRLWIDEADLKPAIEPAPNGCAR